MHVSTRGKLVAWKSDRSFGFIRPDEGGKDVFVHIRDFGNIERTPQAGDTVCYQRMSDGKGRFRAADVRIEGLAREVVSRADAPAKQLARRRLHSTGPVHASDSRAWFVVMGFASVLIALSVFSPLPVVVPVAYLCASLFAFLLYAFDKAAAMNGRWRTSENVLLMIGLLGGWPGALVAQGVFRHKSRKVAFLLPFWTTVIANCAALVVATTERGAAAIRGLLY